MATARIAAGDDPLGLAARIAAGQWDETAQQAVSRAFTIFLRTGAAVDLARCFGLPNTPGRIRRASRDQWLATAARYLACGSVSGGCQLLANEWARFVTRGEWARCRHRAEPPDALLDPFARALWWATYLNAGRTLSAARVAEIPAVTGFFSEKARAKRPMLCTVNPSPRCADATD